MSVDITWSESQAGAAITPPLVWSSIANGGSSSDELYITHDGVEKITACEFYIQAYTGTYSGSFDAATDYAELLDWGGAVVTEGFLIDQNTESGVADPQTHKSTQGTSTTAFALSRNCIIGAAGAGTAGEIEGSSIGTEEAHVTVSIAVPSSESSAGTRQFDQCLAFTYTS
jgi:hypothetical protein